MNSSPANNNTPEESKPCKQRFKGIETFLRRVAFNLGNSPSQTEVKIISCIPIDVTDLQTKIINLERQLHEAKSTKSNPHSSAKSIPVHTALVNQIVPRINTVLSCKCSDVEPPSLEKTSMMATQCGDGSSNGRKSTVSFLFPSRSAVGLRYNSSFMKTNNREDKQLLEPSDHYKNFFRRVKKKKIITKTVKPKTQLVYYAQTNNIPFNRYAKNIDDEIDNYPKMNFENVLGKSYLANVVQRHFDPERVVEEFSDTSHFTSPVCRDFPSNGHCIYESDVCSCCHGQFQNIDNYIGKNQNIIIDQIATNPYNDFNHNIYYDSNHYDVVPVKEKAHRTPKEENLKKELRHQVDMQCWAQNSRTKPHHHELVEYQSKIRSNSKNQKRHTVRLQDKGNNKRKKSPNNVKENKAHQEPASSNTSKSCCVDCSEIYPKPAGITEKPVTLRPILRQNAECLTIGIGSNNLAITRSIQIDLNSTETKTEETLNQIKSILQSVLAEVKTNSQINNPHEHKAKKDAVIQKEPSQSNLHTCSSFLQSFTYNNSFSATPFMAACSRQIPSNFCYANIPCHRMKCTQNFPLLIHAPEHQTCRCFYKNSGLTSRPLQKRAATTATNTEIGEQETQSKETEKLIKEIYKSIAPSVDFPKETSNSDVDIKSVTNMSDFKNVKKTNVAISNTMKRDIQVEALMTPLSTATVRSKYNNSSTDTRSDTKKIEVEPYLHYESQSTETDVVAAEETRNKVKATVASTISEHDSEDLSTDDEDDAILETEEVEVKLEKKGLLQRVLGSVKLFNKKKRIETLQRSTKHSVKQRKETEHSASDSDDYQTIYSEKINNPIYHVNRTQNYKPKIYTAYKPEQQRTNRRSPYMEQEYRRQWNERLTFRENRGRGYSSERPFLEQNQPLYWQNYEARSAMVDQSRSNRQKTYRYNPIQSVSTEVGRRSSPINFVNKKDNSTRPKTGWLKKHKLGINCGEQWKKFIVES